MVPKVFSGTLLKVIYDCAKFHEVSPTGFSKKFDQISKKPNFFPIIFFWILFLGQTL